MYIARLLSNPDVFGFLLTILMFLCYLLPQNFYQIFNGGALLFLLLYFPGLVMISRKTDMFLREDSTDSAPEVIESVGVSLENGSKEASSAIAV
jgi:hypothetical protein